MTGNTRSWPSPRRAAVATSDDTKVYVFAGCLSGDGDTAETTNDLWAYDTDTESWDLLSQPQHNVGYDQNIKPGPRRYPSVDYYDGSLYVFGGCGQNDKYFMLNDLWKFDLESHEWMNIEPNNSSYSDTGNRPPVRYTHQTTVWDNSLYVFSGWYRHHETNHRRCLNDFWRFDFETQSWLQIHSNSPEEEYDRKSKIPGPRYGAMSGRVGSSFYLWGGWSEFQDHNDLWEYHLNAGNWRCIHGDQGYDNNYPEPRYGGSIVEINQNLYLTTGRSRSEPKKRYADLWRYSTEKEIWTQIQGAIPEHQGPEYFGKNAHSVVNNTIYYFAGERYSESNCPGKTHSNALWKYNVADETWALQIP